MLAVQGSQFGVPGVLMDYAIKSCKFQPDQDAAALGVQGVSKNSIVHFVIQFPL
jgi:hypothetical protein